MSVRLFSDNLLKTANLNYTRVSSEKGQFPLANAFNVQRRSKVWRTDGYYKVTSTNNTIIFQETDGVDLTATIAEGEYTSITNFLTAVETALDTAGSSQYDVIQGPSGLTFRINSDLSGGGNILKIDWPNSSAADLLGYSDTLIQEGPNYSGDLIRIHTNEYLEIDFGVPTNPQAFALIGGRNSPIKITPSAILKLQGNGGNTWDNPEDEISLNYDDEVIFTSNSSGLWAEPRRFARLELIDRSNTNNYIEIGSIFLGNFFEGTRGKAQFPWPGEHVDRSRNVTSEGGQTFTDIRQKTERFTVNWFGLTIAEKEEIDQIFLDLGVSQPFFVHFDSNPNLGFSGRSEKYLRYVRFERPPSYQLISPKNFGCTMNFLEEL